MDSTQAEPMAFVAAFQRARRLAINAWRPDTDDRKSWDALRGGLESKPALELLEFCADARPVALGADLLADLFKAPHLAAHAKRFLARLVDATHIFLLAWPAAPSHALPHLVERIGVSARNDAEAVGRLYEAAADLLRSLDGRVLDDLCRRLNVEAWPAARLLMEWAPALTQQPSHSAYRTAISPVEHKHPLTAPCRTHGLHPEQPARDLSPDGVVAQTHPAYEYREGQVQMAKAVHRALIQSEILAVEAGTGTGKSLAYLLPAIRRALSTGRRVVVSTNTKSLQDQLLSHDIPLVHEAISEPFRAAALKGRGNYICVRRAFARAEDARASLFLQERLQAAFLIRWLMESDSGEVADISPEARAALDGLDRLLEEVRSDGNYCLGRTCAWRTCCAVERARRRAENAHIVVVNHALLLADTASQVMPDYEHLIVDEAHNFEDVATDQFGAETSRWTLGALLRETLGDDARGGLLRTVSARLQRAAPAEVAHDVRRALTECEKHARAVAGEIGLLGEAVADFVQTSQPTRADGFTRAAVRITDDVRQSERWSGVREAASAVGRAASALAGGIAQVAEGLAELWPNSVMDLEGLQREVEGLMARWQEQVGVLTNVIAGLSPDEVCWIECDQSKRGTVWALRSAPICVGDALADRLYSRKKTVVFTSATLTVDRRFDYFRQRVGLDSHADRLVELRVPSPFDFARQLLLCIPTDMPLPSERAYQEALWASILGLARAAGGGTLVLFTARTTMHRAYEELQPRLEAEGLQLLCQDISGSRSDLLDRLRRSDGTVLFGVKSFWEGVDVPGYALRLVVIAKLPFSVPTDPLIEARREHLERRGVDSQNDYYIPQAIIGFRQGFGRLIRRRTDRGVVAVLDRRMLTRAYGRRFLESLDGYALLCRPLEACVAAVERWLANSDR